MLGIAHAAARGLHFAPKAKRIIFLFLNGGMSQVDTFDPKPVLDQRDGEPMPGPELQTDRAAGNLMKSPFRFARHGQRGLPSARFFRSWPSAPMTSASSVRCTRTTATTARRC
jgi:hypothetical protein